MIKEMKMKKCKEEISFQKAVGNINRSGEKGHLQNDKNNPGNGKMKKDQLQKEERLEFFALNQPLLPIDQPLLKGEMMAKLVSLRKLALFWEASNLPKKLIKLYFNKNVDELIHVIRVYDVSQINFNGKNAHHYYEIAIPYHQGFWFVKGLLSNRSYIAEIGVIWGSNTFFPLIRSNIVHTPKHEMTVDHVINPDMCKLHHDENKPPEWTEHVSTYSYYMEAENDNPHIG